MLLRYSLALDKQAEAVEKAVRTVLDDPKSGGKGLRTKDLQGAASTSELGDAIVEALENILRS